MYQKSEGRNVHEQRVYTFHLLLISDTYDYNKVLTLPNKNEKK
jgi:hypothetical protein